MDFFSFIKTVFSVYWGSYIFGPLYLFSLIFIFFSKIDRKKKNILFWYSVIVILLLCTPISVYLGGLIWGGSIAYYCRLFSILPIFFTISYGIIIAIQKLKDPLRAISLLLIIFVIAAGGKCFYKADSISLAQNFNKMPNDVIEICEMLPSDTTTLKVAAHGDISKYIRQYDSSIKMPYGRLRTNVPRLAEILLLDSMECDQAMEALAEAQNNECDFIIVKNNKVTENSFDSIGVKKFNQTDNYLIYEVGSY